MERLSSMMKGIGGTGPMRLRGVCWAMLLSLAGMAVVLAAEVSVPVAGTDPNDPNDPNSGPVDPNLVPSQRTDIIRTLEFTGNKKFKKKTLKKRVGIEQGARFDPFLAEGGRRTILEVYRKIGYAFVQADWDREKAKQGELLYTIDEGPRVRIKGVRLAGNQTFSSHSLKKILRNRKRKWYGKAVYYTDLAVREDADKLREFYYRRGYLGYEVATEVEYTKDQEGAIVTFVIEEGPPYRIEQILFTGNEIMSEELLQEKLTIAVGEIYKRDEAERNAKDMKEYLLERGFINAQVVQGPRFKPDTEEPIVTIEFEVAEGRQFRIGRIDVSGNDMCQDKVSRRVLDEYGFSPGELYNAKIASGRGDSKLENYVRRASLAEEVVIQPVNSAEGDPNTKDVRLDMTEGMTGMIMPGIGISSDDGLIGQLIYQQRNFDATDWPQSWKEFFTMKGFRGAGQTMRIALEPGTEVNRYSIEWTNPYFNDRPVDFDLSARRYNRWLESYDERRTAGIVGFEHRTWGTWRKSIRFRAENVEVQDIETYAPADVWSAQGNNYIYSLNLGTGLAEMDDIYMPTEGYNLRLNYEQATGDYDFGLASGSFTNYFPVYEDILERRTYIATRFQGGYVLGSAPVFERFYAGGQGRYSVRGFDFRGISTRAQGVDINGNPGGGLYPVGSDWVVTASSELVVPLIAENFAGLAFMDAGLIDSGGWRLSAGLGIQILIPQWFGPVPMRFEYGYPIRYDVNDDTRRFSFSMGALF